MKSILKKILDIREFVIALTIVLACVALSLASPYFLTAANINAVLLGLSINAIIAVAMTVVMVAGGFDMSVGATLAFVGSMTGLMIKAGLPVPIAVLAGLAIGGLIGLVNGLIIAKVGINAFITTLGTQMLFRGLLQVITDGRNVTSFPSSFKALGQAKILGVQTPIIIAAVVIIVGDIMLRNSKFMRKNYYIGGNEKASKLSGIDVVGVKIFGYVLAGVLAALAGIVMTARLGTASISAGGNTAFEVITAVVIGGASLSGGEGTVFGAFLGCLLMALINNALTLLGINVYWNSFVIGATLLGAVIIDYLNQKKRESALAR